MVVEAAAETVEVVAETVVTVVVAPSSSKTHSCGRRERLQLHRVGELLPLEKQEQEMAMMRDRVTYNRGLRELDCSQIHNAIAIGSPRHNPIAAAIR
jgi:hypothetical protein